MLLGKSTVGSKKGLGLADRIVQREMMRLLLGSVGIELRVGKSTNGHRVECPELEWDMLNDAGTVRWPGENIRPVAGY
jgi:hypothetical protein